MDEADKSVAAYETLHKSIPPIGFMNRKKRVIAYLKVTKLAQEMIDEGLLSEDNAKYILSILVRKHASFQKATMMAALNLSSIDKKLISSLGFQYANEFRCNMQMHPVD